MTQTVLAIVFGLLFGFVLYRSGAANPQRIIDMLRLKDAHLVKVILMAIGTSSLLLFISGNMGLVAPHFSVKTAYVGVMAGAVIFGVGWALSGFCPGTSIVAAGTGRKDAWVFILGGLLGAFVYMVIYGDIKDTVLFDKLFDGKATLVDTGVSTYHILIEGVSTMSVAGGLAILFIIIAFILPASKKI